MTSWIDSTSFTGSRGFINATTNDFNYYGNNTNTNMYTFTSSISTFTNNKIILASPGNSGGTRQGGHAIYNNYNGITIINYGALVGGGGGGASFGGIGGIGGGGGGGGGIGGGAGGNGGSILNANSNGFRSNSGGIGSSGASGGGGASYGGIGGNATDPRNSAGGAGGTTTNYIGSNSIFVEFYGGGGGAFGGNGSSTASFGGIYGSSGGGGGGGSGGGKGGSGPGGAGGNGGYSIYNTGTITDLYNSQGVNTIYGPLFYGGSSLPTNYNIRINSTTNYGQLFCTGWAAIESGSCNINIDPASTMDITIETTFSNVLVGNCFTTYSGTGTINGNSVTYNIVASSAVTVGSISYNAYNLVITPMPLAAPTSVFLSSTNNSITATVNQGNNNGNPVNGYYYAINGTSYGAFISYPSAPNPFTFTFTGSYGSSYYINVIVVNSAGNSEATTSNTVIVYTTPSEPTSLSLTPGNTSIAYSFSAPSSNGGSEITSYEYSIDGTNYTNIGLSTSGTITGLLNGTSYTVYIIANNETGSGYSVSASTTPYTVPSAPTSLSLTPGNTSIAYSFSAPSSNNGNEITSYAYSTNGTNYTNIGLSTSGTITDLLNETSYTVYIIANNEAGSGSSVSAQVTTLLSLIIPIIPTKNYYFLNNNSLDTIFALNTTFNGSLTTNYKNNGIDIGKRYITTGIGASTTNYQLNAADLNTKFLKTSITNTPLLVDRLSIVTKNAILPNTTTVNSTVPSSGVTPTAASISAGIYGCKLLFSSYTGPVMTIRRSSNSITAHFYADSIGTLGSNYLGTGTTLSTWLNGDIPYVQIWWDQTGNGNHAYQFTTDNQPQYDTVNKYITFPGTTFFNLPDGAHPYGDSQYTYVFKCSITSTSGGIFIGGSSNNNQANAFRRDPTFGYRNHWFNVDITPATNVYSDNSIISILYDGLNRTMYTNNVVIAGPQASSGRQQTNGNNTIGKSVASEYMGGGYIKYMYIIPIAISNADRLILENT